MIYDAHSHIGVDAFHFLPSTIEGYLQKAEKLNIDEANLMPVPSPVYTDISGTIIKPLTWKFEDNSFHHYKIEKNEDIIFKNCSLNPYSEFNNLLRNNLLNQSEELKLNFIPLIHPIYDRTDYVNSLLDLNPRAVKIHGIASGIFPEQTRSELLELFSQRKIPVIIHTDFYTKDPREPIELLYKNNTASRWLSLFQENSVKAYITHGARLEKNAFDIINNSDLFVVGLSPDILITNEPKRLSRNLPYLETILDEIDINKICFDLDYSWNLINRENSKLDLTLPERLKDILSSKNLSSVLYDNANNFFNSSTNL